MKKKSAFVFFPELIGDAAKILKAPSNPQRMYIDAAVETIRAATKIFQAVADHKLTQKSNNTLEFVEQKYNLLYEDMIRNFKTEHLKRLEIEYSKIEPVLDNNQYNNTKVKEFIKLLKSELEKIIKVIRSMPDDIDFSEQNRIYEIYRKSLRDYDRLINLFIEEETNNERRSI